METKSAEETIIPNRKSPYFNLVTMGYGKRRQSMFPDPEEIKKSWPGWEDLCEKLQEGTFQALEYDGIVKLEEDFDEFRNYYIRASRIRDSYGPGSGPFSKECKRIAARKKELGCKENPRIAKYYAENISMSEKERVNGYQLYEKPEHIDNLFDYESFQELSKIWDRAESISDADFLEWLEDNCCTDWSKQDRHGKSYGGFWKYPEGSEERENAYTLSREDNFKGLLDLPFPREIIKRTVTIGCSNRKESVRYSNFICTWLQRKKAYMAKQCKDETNI